MVEKDRKIFKDYAGRMISASYNIVEGGADVPVVLVILALIFPPFGAVLFLLAVVVALFYVAAICVGTVLGAIMSVFGVTHELTKTRRSIR